LAVDFRVSLSSWIVALAPPPRSTTRFTCLVGGKVTAGLDTAGRLTFTTVGTGTAATIKIGVANPTW
jgi:hypothetical protein